MSVHVAIEITPEKLRYYSNESSQFELVEEIPFVNQTDFAYKEVLVETMSKILKISSIENMTCSYVSPFFTLVPTSLFSSSKPETLLGFSVHKEIPKDNVEYNRLQEWNAVLIYELPLWIKSVLVPKFPRIIIQHELSHSLRYLNSGSLALPKMMITLNENSFSIATRNNGEIVHCSFQEFQNEDDILYHILMSVEKLNALGTIEFVISHGNQSEIAQKLVEKAKRIEQLAKQKFTLSRFQHIQNHSLCV
ncbi:MAG: DUF3822 family protein [Fluviicola sp.]